jgi:hypothetical protein
VLKCSKEGSVTESIRPAKVSLTARRDVERFESTTGVVEAIRLARGIVGSTMTGRLDEALTRATLEYTDRMIALDGPLLMFHDWEAMTGYDSISRKLCTEYAVDKFRMMRGAHMLVRSSIVAMGISTANLVTWPVGVELTAHRDRASFEHARQKALA